MVRAMASDRATRVSLLKDILYPLLFDILYPKSASKRGGRQRERKDPGESEAEPVVGYPEVEEFAEYFSSELVPSLPSGEALSNFDPSSYNPPPELLETLLTYSIFPDSATAEVFLEDLITSYLKVLESESARSTAGPPDVGVLRAALSGIKECEICEREVPLTFHHLIPREVHAKAVKRKWHRKEDLNMGAWICRPCHSMVHRLEDNETLARKFYTVELLMESEEMRRWAAWIGRQRFQVKRG